MLNYGASIRPKKIILSRTDSIGDVILTLPLAGVLKEYFPDTPIIFLGRSYTEPVINACTHIDDFINWDEISGMPGVERARFLNSLGADVFINVFPRFAAACSSWRSGIGLRIGTRRRWFHWFMCNRTVSFSRKKSELHEAQLNLKLLSPLGVNRDFSKEELFPYYGLTQFKPLRPEIKNLLDPERVNLILHPKSRGSAVEWGMDNFLSLIELLPPERYRIFITGTKDDADGFSGEIPFDNSHVVNLAGRVSLDELISFIGLADGLVASSTGPLHIGAAAGKFVLGLFCPRKPIHPGRWAPIGERAGFLLYDKSCSDCEKGLPCRCIEKIEPQVVKERIDAGFLQPDLK